MFYKDQETIVSMSRLFEVSIQVIGDDNDTTEKVEQRVEAALSSLKISEVFVRETEYLGDLEDEEDEEYEGN